MSARPAVLVGGLTKSFGELRALDGIDLEVPSGTVLGLLGPNGAGKTTVVRILTTLLVPDGGRAEVAGYDVVRDAAALRSVIGLAGQNVAVDDHLTGRENLELVGRLYHLGRQGARRSAEEMLERFDLSDAADRQSKTYSGGMRRRLDLGASLIGRPQVLFLDEPTTGLDPPGRLGLWDVIEQLVRDGTTLLLTTQYLEEADRLATTIVVIDQGRVIAQGTADELKSRIGGNVLRVTLGRKTDLVKGRRALATMATGEVTVDREARRISLPVAAATTVLADAVRLLDRAGVVIADLGLHRPTLDDVFLVLTGHAADDAGHVADDAGQAAVAAAAAPPSPRRRSA